MKKFNTTFLSLLIGISSVYSMDIPLQSEHLKTIDQRDAGQLFLLGRVFYVGPDDQRDFKKAFELFTLAAAQGDMNAQCDLGNMYNRGDYVRQDFKKAFDFYSLAAKQGCLTAQNNLATMYQKGDYVQRDLKMAFELFSLVANQGCSTAQNHLGDMYEEGGYVRRDLQKAFEFYTKSAAQNNPYAQRSLANMYYHGMHVKKDFAKSFEFFSLAANQEDYEAQSRLGVMYAHGLGVKRDLQKAFEFYSLAADQGYAGGLINLANMYKNGDYVKQDYNKAMELYTIAANQGNFCAQEQIDLLFSKIAANKRKQNKLSSKSKMGHNIPLQKTKDQEIVEEAERFYNERKWKPAFEKYLEAKELGNKQAEFFLKEYCAGQCKNSNLQNLFNETLRESQKKKIPQQEEAVKETLPSQKKKKKRKKKAGGAIVQPSVVNAQKENDLTPQITIQAVQPSLDLQQEIPEPVQQPVVTVPVVTVTETQTGLSPFVKSSQQINQSPRDSSDRDTKEISPGELDKKPRRTIRIANPMKKVKQWVDNRGKTAGEKNEAKEEQKRKKQSSKYKIPKEIGENPSISESFKESASVSKTHVSITDAESTCSKSMVSESEGGFDLVHNEMRSSYPKLHRLLKKTKAVNISDITFKNDTVLRATLVIMRDFYGLIDGHINLGNIVVNKKGESTSIFNAHTTHGSANHAIWYHNPAIVKDFFIFVANSDPIISDYLKFKFGENCFSRDVDAKNTADDAGEDSA